MEADTDDSANKQVSTPITITDSKAKSNNMSPSCTPLLDSIENNLSKQQFTLGTSDSGFSEWTPNSVPVVNLGETPHILDLSSSMCSTPSEADFLSNSSGSSEFHSRNHRRSWPFKSRKLFCSPDIPQLSESAVQLKHEETVTLEEDEAEMNKILSRSEDINIMKQDLLFKVLHRSRSCSRSPLSSLSDDLENSFHEMSLEENSSDSAVQSPTHFAPSPLSTFSHHLKSNDISVNDESASPSPYSSMHDIPSICSEENISQKCEEEPENSGRTTSFSDSKNVELSCPVQSDVHAADFVNCHSSSTVNMNEAQLSLVNSHHLHLSTLPDTQNSLHPHRFNTDFHTSLNCDNDSPFPLTYDHNFVKSPTKRSCNAPEHNCLDSVSPVKLRKLRSESSNVLEVDASKRDLFGCQNVTKGSNNSSSDILDVLPTTKKVDQSGVKIQLSDDRTPQFVNINSIPSVSYELKDLTSVDHATPVRWRISENKNVNERSENRDEILIQRICLKFSPSNPAQLIGRHVGLKKFDIIGELQQHNLIECVEIILAYIPDSDLIKIVEVSSLWRTALLEESKAQRRYKSLLKKLSSPRKRNQAEKENMMDKLRERENVQMTTSKGHLTSIQPRFVGLETSHPMPLPKQTNLQSEDVLRNCPHCQSRAVVLPSQDRACCLSDKCTYDFCTKCFCPFHHPSPCKPLFHSASKTTLAGTKKSKRNLKRLKNLL